MMLVPCITSYFTFIVPVTYYSHSLVTALCLPQNWALVHTVIPYLFIERRSWIKSWVCHTYEIQEQLVEALKPGGRGFRSWRCHLNFSLTQSFRPHYGPGVNSASDRNEYHKYFLGSKGGRCLGLTTLPPSCADCLVIWQPQSPGSLRSFSGLYRDCFTFYI